MRLRYPNEDKKKRTKNKTLMEYAVEYVEQRNVNKAVLKYINYVRLKKGILLPCEVVGANGRMRMECYNNINVLSSIKWDFQKILSMSINREQKNA